PKGFGVDNRGTRTDFIIGRLQELLYTYGDRIYFDDVFRQLRYFTCVVSDAGKEKWGTPDKKRHPDDLLFAIVFSYICRMCFLNKEPSNVSSEEKRYRKEYR